MARATVENNKRLQLRMSPAHKARIVRAAAIQNMDLTQFVTRAALREADAIIAECQVESGDRGAPGHAVTRPAWHDEPIPRSGVFSSSSNAANAIDAIFTLA
jgi:hypothetical protein